MRQVNRFLFNKIKFHKYVQKNTINVEKLIIYNCENRF